MIRELIDAGADPNIISANGNTAKDLAINQTTREFLASYSARSEQELLEHDFDNILQDADIMPCAGDAELV